MTTLVQQRDGCAPRIGVLLLLAEIVMLFAAFTSAMIVRKGASNDWIQTRLPSIFYLSSLPLLLASAVLWFLGKRLRAVIEQNSSSVWRICFAGLTAAVFCGAGFLVCQWLAIRELAVHGAQVASDPGSSFLWVFITAHGLHLLGGMTGLVYVAFRMNHAGQLKLEWTRSAIDASAIYWYFMTGLWIYILVLFTVQL